MLIQRLDCRVCHLCTPSQILGVLTGGATLDLTIWGQTMRIDMSADSWIGSSVICCMERPTLFMDVFEEKKFLKQVFVTNFGFSQNVCFGQFFPYSSLSFHHINTKLSGNIDTIVAINVTERYLQKRIQFFFGGRLRNPKFRKALYTFGKFSYFFFFSI